jgi:hypothetical protein
MLISRRFHTAAMPTQYLAIPAPCHEDWNRMTTTERGRFCLACQKEVVDFSGLAPADILAVLRGQPNGSVCGRIPLATLQASRAQALAAAHRRHWPGRRWLSRALAALGLPLLVAPRPAPAQAESAAPRQQVATAPNEPTVRLLRLSVVEPGTGAGLGFAVVEVWQHGRRLLRTQAEADGTARLRLPAEAWTDTLQLRVQLSGYRPYEQALRPAAAGPALRVVLQPGAVALPEMVRQEKEPIRPQTTVMGGAISAIDVKEVPPAKPRPRRWFRWGR